MRVEFRLSMPGKGSWDGKWSGEGRDYLIYKTLSIKTIKFLGLDTNARKSWHHSWDDGWRARIDARVMNPGERKQKSAGFCGYDWMIDNIILYNQTEKPERMILHENNKRVAE